MQGAAWTEGVTRVVDLRGLCIGCIGPILYVKRELSSVPLGGVMELISPMEETRDDIAFWAGHTGQEYLGARLDRGFDHIFVRRRR